MRCCFGCQRIVAAIYTRKSWRKLTILSVITSAMGLNIANMELRILNAL